MQDGPRSDAAPSTEQFGPALSIEALPTSQTPGSPEDVGSVAVEADVNDDDPDAISSWDDCAIAIDQDRSIKVFSPRPEQGGLVRLKDGKPIDVPGKTILTLMECFAESADGIAAPKTRLMHVRVTQRHVFAQETESEVDYADEGNTVLKGLQEDLRKTMAYCNKVLKKRIGPTDTLFQVGGDKYVSAAPIGFLIRDQKGCIRFTSGS